MMVLMLCSEGIRVGLVDSDEIISLGRLLRNAPKQFIVRGICFDQRISTKKSSSFILH